MVDINKLNEIYSDYEAANWDDYDLDILTKREAYTVPSELIGILLHVTSNLVKSWENYFKAESIEDVFKRISIHTSEVVNAFIAEQQRSSEYIELLLTQTESYELAFAIHELIEGDKGFGEDDTEPTDEEFELLEQLAEIFPVNSYEETNEKLQDWFC